MVRKIIVLREGEAGRKWNVQIRSEDPVIMSIFIQRQRLVLFPRPVIGWTSTIE